jgi:vacuolar iron transporter family protein
VDIAQSLENLKLEQDAIVLYDALATIEKDPRRSEAFRHIAANERRHAEVWANRLRDLGASVPPPSPARPRVRFIILAARVLGTRAVSDLVKALEGDEVEVYDAQAPTTEIASIADDEREHAEIWKRLDAGEAPRLAPSRVALAGRGEVADDPGDVDGAREADEPGDAAAAGADDGTGGADDDDASDDAADADEADDPGAGDDTVTVMDVDGPADAAAADARGRATRRGAASAIVTAAAHPPIGDGTTGGPEDITSNERWHRSARSGTLRAVIFGVSDGLVSNLSLVMGVAGASGQGGIILLAGVAGLLAGAFSMAAGEYVSMQSQRELFERQIELERAELEAMPGEEQRELAAIYVSKGFPREEAERVAARMFEDPATALDTLVREELGLDPDELGSPWGAAGGSFAAFAVGAVIPVLPYLLGSGTPAFVASLAMSLVALFAVGAGVSLLTGKGVLFSGLRQLGIGAAAAAVTWLVGTIIGVGVQG